MKPLVTCTNLATKVQAICTKWKIYTVFWQNKSITPVKNLTLFTGNKGPKTANIYEICCLCLVFESPWNRENTKPFRLILIVVGPWKQLDSKITWAELNWTKGGGSVPVHGSFNNLFWTVLEQHLRSNHKGANTRQRLPFWMCSRWRRNISTPAANLIISKS